jgi:hypothetical protein
LGRRDQTIFGPFANFSCFHRVVCNDDTSIYRTDPIFWQYSTWAWLGKSLRLVLAPAFLPSRDERVQITWTSCICCILEVVIIVVVAVVVGSRYGSHSLKVRIWGLDLQVRTGILSSGFFKVMRVWIDIDIDKWARKAFHFLWTANDADSWIACRLLIAHQTCCIKFRISRCHGCLLVVVEYSLLSKGW